MGSISSGSEPATAAKGAPESSSQAAPATPMTTTASATADSFDTPSLGMTMAPPPHQTRQDQAQAQPQAAAPAADTDCFQTIQTELRRTMYATTLLSKARTGLGPAASSSTTVGLSQEEQPHQQRLQQAEHDGGELEHQESLGPFASHSWCTALDLPPEAFGAEPYQLPSAEQQPQQQQPHHAQQQHLEHESHEDMGIISPGPASDLDVEFPRIDSSALRAILPDLPQALEPHMPADLKAAPTDATQPSRSDNDSDGSPTAHRQPSPGHGDSLRLDLERVPSLDFQSLFGTGSTEADVATAVDPPSQEAGVPYTASDLFGDLGTPQPSLLAPDVGGDSVTAGSGLPEEDVPSHMFDALLNSDFDGGDGPRPKRSKGTSSAAAAGDKEDDDKAKAPLQRKGKKQQQRRKKKASKRQQQQQQQQQQPVPDPSIPGATPEAPLGYTVDGRPRKRRPKRQVPDYEKDDAYWRKRAKNTRCAQRNRERQRALREAQQRRLRQLDAQQEQLTASLQTLRKRAVILRNAILAEYAHLPQEQQGPNTSLIVQCVRERLGKYTHQQPKTEQEQN